MNKSFLFSFVAFPLLLLGIYIPIELWNVTAGNMSIMSFILKDGNASVTVDTLIPITLFLFAVLNPGFMIPRSFGPDQYYFVITEGMNVFAYLVWVGALTHPDPNVEWITQVLLVTIAMTMNISGVIRYIFKR